MIINEIPYYILRSLLFTIIIELIMALILGIRYKKDLLNVILVNLITNPIVNITVITLNIYVGLTARNYSLYILEVLVLLTEGLIYRKVLSYKKINWFLVSLILNISSFGIGEVINHFI